MKLPPGHVPGMGVRKATAYGGYGERMLRRWGWEKGDGCGRERQGISEAIEVKKKDDTSGVSRTGPLPPTPAPLGLPPSRNTFRFN